MEKTKKKTTTKPIDAAGKLPPTTPETEPNTLVVDPQSGVQMVDTGHFMALDALIEYENNAKIHTPEQIEQICESIRQFGFLDPIAYGRDNIIVEGHGRLYAARKIGMGTVPVINVSHLDDAHQRAYILAHNKLTINTGFDTERYAAELAQICIELPDLPVIDLGIFDTTLQEEMSPPPPTIGNGGQSMSSGNYGDKSSGSKCPMSILGIGGMITRETAQKVKDALIELGAEESKDNGAIIDAFLRKCL